MPPARTALLALALSVGIAPGCVSKQRVDQAASRVELGAAYLRENNAPGAIQVLREATRKDPRSWNAWNKLGLAYLAQGAMKESEAAFKKAVRLDDNAEVRNNYGYMLMRSGDLPGAVAQFEAALTDLTYRKPAVVLSNLGHALHLSGQHETAIARLSEAIERAPNMCQARFNRGLAYTSLGRRESALDDFEVVINMCGKEASGAYLQAARLLIEVDDRKGACSYLRVVMDDARRSNLGDAASDLHARVCL